MDGAETTHGPVARGAEAWRGAGGQVSPGGVKAGTGRGLPESHYDGRGDGGTTMGKGRLEAFSDGVIAIIITIMVLELEVPHAVSFASLVPLLPVLLSYVLSFVYVGIYWNNHHHMLAACRHVSGAALWANLHLLFWLSLFPFTTAWMGENHFAAAPTAAYGGVLLMAALAYWILQRILMGLEGHDSVLTRAMGNDWKGKLSPFFYVAGIASTFWLPWIALVLYAMVAVVWLIPDRRIERVFPGGDGRGAGE
jgi:uncharacterized membrane protein